MLPTDAPNREASPFDKIKQYDYREPVFKRGAARTVQEEKQQKHSEVSDLRVGLSIQPSFDDTDDEDEWGIGKYQWKGDAFRFSDIGMKDEKLVDTIKADTV